MPDNFNNQSQPAPAGGSIPPPPAPGGSSVDIRTQASDIQSIKQSGGGSPIPEQFNLGEINSPPVNQSSLNNQSAASYPPASAFPENNISPAPGGSASVSPDGEPVFNPGAAPANSASLGHHGLNLRTILILVSILVLVGLLIWVGYAYVYPLFFPAPPPAVNLTTPASSSESTGTSVAETPAVVATHSPYANFSTSNTIGPVVASATFSVDLASAIRSQTTTASAGSVIEVKVVTADGDQASFQNFLPFLISDNFSFAEISPLFLDDFTAFVYYDDNLKAWPGYIAKLKPEASLLDGQTVFRNLESSGSLSSFFLEDPGSPNSDGWKDGQINSLPSRYLTWSNGGALNYFWSGDVLVITTSYPGAQAIIPLLR